MDTRALACTVDPSPAALERPGRQADGSVILVNGRLTNTAGDRLWLTGLGADVSVHPTTSEHYLAFRHGERSAAEADARITRLLEELVDGGHAHGPSGPALEHLEILAAADLGCARIVDGELAICEAPEDQLAQGRASSFLSAFLPAFFAAFFAAERVRAAASLDVHP